MKMFDINVGLVDRILRVLIGSALVAWYLLASGPVWALIGFVPIFTGVLARCPAYGLLGVCTLKKDGK